MNRLVALGIVGWIAFAGLGGCQGPDPFERRDSGATGAGGQIVIGIGGHIVTGNGGSGAGGLRGSGGSGAGGRGTGGSSMGGRGMGGSGAGGFAGAFGVGGSSTGELHHRNCNGRLHRGDCTAVQRLHGSEPRLVRDEMQDDD
jgi:hypothetical protein